MADRLQHRALSRQTAFVEVRGPLLGSRKEAKVLLGAFSEKGWDNTVKEGLFTGPLSKAIALQSEAMNCGDIGVANKMKDFAECLQRCKGFLKTLS